jgi:hypothetical protein
LLLNVLRCKILLFLGVLRSTVVPSTIFLQYLVLKPLIWLAIMSAVTRTTAVLSSCTACWITTLLTLQCLQATYFYAFSRWSLRMSDPTTSTTLSVTFKLVRMSVVKEPAPAMGAAA